MIIAKAGAQTQKELIPAGNYVARCYRMIHIGTNFSETWQKNIDQIRITWELPTETRVFNEDKGEQPFVIDRQYTLSLHEKATLRKDLESWRGKGFNDEELKGFDLTDVMGTYCMLNIIHKEASNGNTYSNIGSIAALPKGMNKPEAVNKDVIFDYDNYFDMDFIDALPDFIREPLRGSIEYKDKILQLEGKSHDKAAGVAVEYEDDLPFD